jgi:hypothetical protein
MIRVKSRTIMLAVALLALSTAMQADAKKALADTEGRRKAAENGASQIKAKSSSPAGDIENAYTAAAAANNAWLVATTASLETGAEAAPDVAQLADRAGTTLVTWVNHRNKALSLPELSGLAATSIAKAVANDLIEIASSTWRDNRKSSPAKRNETVKTLSDRLRWNPWREIR